MVVPVSQLPNGALQRLLRDYGMTVEWVADDCAIPGSYWKDCEAGLIENRLYVRADTPVHSALHEAGHYICMDAARRSRLHTDAGGSDQEECGVCYLQILLAGRLDGYSIKQSLADMDAWGYSFRLGSAAAWFEQDADDARLWLTQRNLLPAAPTHDGALP